MTTEHCAACGKESETLKTCSGCNAVKYCNADCQKVHRKQHQADCKKRAAEFEVALFEIGKRAAELFDEILFKKPPSMEDCPICMLQLPLLSDTPNIYLPCCGKTLCDGCMDEMLMLITERERYNCPFCRTSMIDSEKFRVERCMKRMKADDADAFNMMGSCYLKGSDEGLQKDTEKALEMYLRAAELGSVEAHNNICSNVLFWTIGCRNRSREVHVSLAASSNKRVFSFKVQSWEFGSKSW